MAPDTQAPASSSQLQDVLSGGNNTPPITPQGPQQPPTAPDVQPPAQAPPALAGSAQPPPPSAGQPSVWKDLAMGALWGLAGASRSGALSGHRGGADAFAAGAAGGAEGVLVDEPAAKAQQALTAADIKFKSAQAADMQINYAYKEQQLNNLSQEQQDAHAEASLKQLEAFKSMGLTPVAVTGDNPGDAQATGRNLMQSHGGVPPLYTVDIGHQHVSFDLNQVAGTTQGLALLNRQRADMGQQALTPQQFAAMYPNQTAQVGAMHSAMDFAHPVIVDQKSLDDAKARLNTIQGQRTVTPEMRQDMDSLQSAITIGEKSVKEQNDTANKNAQAKAQAERLGKESTPGGQAQIAERQANAAKTRFETTQQKRDAASFQQPDVTGFTPTISQKEYERRFDAFTKSKGYTTLQTLQGSYQQFQSIVGDINSGKDMTGSESVVGLFNAIGISATPLAGKGMRINNNTIQEHVGARSLGQAAYQKLLGLKNGDVITPQQLKDYASIATQVYSDTYVNMVDEAHRQGLPADFLPQGGGRAIDRATASIYAKSVLHTNPKLASNPQALKSAIGAAEKANGWGVQ